jgi:hypothetical protein
MNVDNMHDLLNFTVIGVSTDSGQATNITLSGSAPFGLSFGAHLTDGQLVFAHRYYSDFVTAGSEWGYGTYNAGSSQITGWTLIRSSESPSTTKVTWSGAQTYVAISTSKELMANAARAHLELGPTTPILFAATGQSNLTVAPQLTSNNEPIPDFSAFLQDWSTPQIEGAFDRADLDWRAVDMINEYSSQQNNTGKGYVGVYRRYNKEATRGQEANPGNPTWAVSHYQAGPTPPTVTGAGWLWVDTADNFKTYISRDADVNDQITTAAPHEWQATEDDEWAYNSQVAYLVAGYLCMIMGRQGRLVSVQYSGIDIDDDIGWRYETGTENMAEILKEELGLAIAADPDLNGVVTHPHFFIYQQGENEAFQGRTSQEYGFLLDDVLKSFYDPDRWDICKRGFTRGFVIDGLQGEDFGKETFPDWVGHHIACELNRENVSFIPTDGLIQYQDTYDPVHYTERGSFQLARRILNEIITGGSGNSATGSAAISPFRGLVDTNTTNTAGLITVIADSNSLPPSNNQAYFNEAQDTFYISKTMTTSNMMSPGGDVGYGPIRHLKPLTANHPDNPLRVRVLGFFSVNLTFDVNGIAQDHGTYFSIPVANPNITTATGTGFVSMNRNGNPHLDYSSLQLVSRLRLPISSDNFEKDSAVYNQEVAPKTEGIDDYSPTYATRFADIVRFKNLMEYVVEPRQTIGLTPSHPERQIWKTALTDYQTNGQYIFLEATVYGQDDGTASNTFAIRTSAGMRWSGTTWTVHSGARANEVLDNGTNEPTFTFEAFAESGIQFVGLVTGGVSGKTWNINAYVTARVLGA